MMVNLQHHSQGLGSHPALLLVDLIRGFTDPACALGSQADDVVAANLILLADFREKKLPIYFTTVVYRDSGQAAVFRARVPALNELQAGSAWVEIDERLGRLESEPLIEKQWASGFFKTDLNERLRQQNVDSVVVTGLTTSGCVRATAVDALQYDYRVVIPREAVGDRNADAHRTSLFDLNAKYADVMSLNEVVTEVGRLHK